MGLTSCKQGVRNTVTNEVYWHGNYQVEEAHKAFNAGAVVFNKDKLEPKPKKGK